MSSLRKIRTHRTALSTRGRLPLYLLCALFLALYFTTLPLAWSVKAKYEDLEARYWKDRTGFILSREGEGFLPTSPEEIPERFEALLLRKEDRYFYYHLGVNPWSMARGLVSKIRNGRAEGSSTITQQLLKVLLGNEADRTVYNKLVESLLAFAFELHESKREILGMYANVAYFGKRERGIKAASHYFFGKKPASLSEAEMITLIAALGSPSTRFPGSVKGGEYLASVGSVVGSPVTFIASSTPLLAPPVSTESLFEIESLVADCEECELTIDATLSDDIRAILQRRLESAASSNVSNGAVVVIGLPQNEILSIVGSPNPRSLKDGAQLNMALEPRPIGSTAKPFIYARAFEKGARPYTLLYDEEYRFEGETGFGFYPKNFDGKFRGAVTMHEALANSLNVPAVKTLSYVGLPDFYDFLENSLRFRPRQPLPRYALGIALGALEMDLLTLSHFFTIFPNGGILRPLTIEKLRRESFQAPMEEAPIKETRVLRLPAVELVTKILSDREAGVEQFGLRSNLTLPYKNYALKTGTSRDYHDSWTIGFTPDFLVGVWLGNSDNTPMRELTGQTGAGALWGEVMMLLYSSAYNRDTPFTFDSIKEFTNSGSIEYGLPGDGYDLTQNLLEEPTLILSPHDGDIIEFGREATIPLKSPVSVDWFVDKKYAGSGEEVSVSPSRAGEMRIEAKTATKSEIITIMLSKED